MPMTDKVTAFQKELMLHGESILKMAIGDISVVPSVCLNLETEFSSLLKTLPKTCSGF